MDQTTVMVNGSDMKLTNGNSQMESEPESDAFSDSGDLVSELNAEKLDPSDRVLYEKLKQQEREEREEIERELKEHEDSYGISKQQIRAREQEMHLAQERMQQRSEQRELDLSTAGNAKFPASSGGIMAAEGNNNNNNSFSESGGSSVNKNLVSGSGSNGSTSSSSSSGVGSGGSSSGGGGSASGSSNGSIGNPLNKIINPSTINSNSNGNNNNSNSSSNTTGGGGSHTNNSINNNSNSINNIADSFLNKISSPPMNHSNNPISTSKPSFLMGGDRNDNPHNPHLSHPSSKTTLVDGLTPPGSKFMPDDLRAHLGLQNATTNFLSSLPLGHPLAHAHLALGGHLLGREGFKGLDGMGMNSMMNPFHPIMSNHSAAFPSPPSPAEPPYPPASTTPHSPTGSLQPSPSPDDPNGENRSHNWTFEEQFKQLYELSDDPKRKEFLDDLFAFMQKRGTPVNRIPIMAKQTLDLYELFRLVVSKGGLVEVINKKLWREITKGLNLPSSITSAAFTLRTQYMKYLYPYECEKMKLSNPSELQAAIDGNRREGRRSSYGYDLSPGPTLVPSNHPLNGGVMNGKLGRASPLSFDGDRPDMRHLAGSNPQGLAFNPALMPLSHHIYSTMMSEKLRHSSPIEDESLPATPLPAHHRGMTERDALAMEAASRAMEDATRKMEAATRAGALDEGPPRKRLLTENDRIPFPASMPNAHFKITSRNDGRSEIDTSLVVSMEINGIMYQGVLFAQHPPRIGV